MTWEICVGIFALVTFAATIGAMVYKLARILTKLETAVDNLRDTITTVKSNNSKEHEKIFEMIDKLNGRLTVVETELLIAGREPNPPRQIKK